MNTEKLNEIKKQITELLTIANAQKIISQAKDNVPSKEQVELSIKALQDVLHNVYEKSLQGASNVDTVYQKTFKSPEIETITAMIYNQKTPEQKQRELEKVIYLYVLNFGTNEFTPPLDLQTMSEEEKRRLFHKLLADNSASVSQIKRMVRELLLLFNNERLGLSAVEYNVEFSENEINEIYKQILDTSRSKEIMDRINSQVNDNEFLKHFVTEIIEDVPSGVANDAKYFGYGSDYSKGIKLRLNNFVKAHNTYITKYIKNGDSLRREIPKLERIIASIDEGRDLSENPSEMDILREATGKLINAIDSMASASIDGNIRVYELQNINNITSDLSKPVVKGDEIVKKAKNVGDRRDRSDSEPESVLGKRNVRPREGEPENESMSGGKRRKRNKVNKTYKRTRRSTKKRRTLRKGGKLHRVKKMKTKKRIRHKRVKGRKTRR